MLKSKIVKIAEKLPVITAMVSLALIILVLTLPNAAKTGRELTRIEASKKLIAIGEIKNNDLSYWGGKWDITSTKAMTYVPTFTCSTANLNRFNCVDNKLNLPIEPSKN